MFSQTFHHKLIRKYVTLFGYLFRNVWVQREDANGKIAQSFKVPITYSPREKLLARIDGMEVGDDPLEQRVAVTLPQMGFEITGFNYAAERKLSTVNRHTRVEANATNRYSFQYNPVPYDINFSLSIFVKNTMDGTMIVEQILPYFTPAWTPTVKLIEDPEIILDIPLVLQDITQEDIYEGTFEERRALVWTLNFIMKGYIFGPTRKEGIITLANTNMFDATTEEDITLAPSVLTDEDRLESIITQPGLTANGEPTTVEEESIDRNSISSTDNWDYIVKKETP